MNTEESTLPRSIADTLTSGLMNRLRFCNPDNKDAFLMFINSRYLAEIINCEKGINRVHVDICMVLTDICGKKWLFGSYNTPDLLCFNIKNYYILWTTLRDKIAKTINTVLDLGINNSYCKWELIISNRHVQETKIPDICKTFSKKIDVDRVIRLRNEIIHNGILDDTDIESLIIENDDLISRKYSFLGSLMNPINDNDYQIETTKLNQKVIDLSKVKYGFLEEHYKITINMINSILEVLSENIVLKCNNMLL